jgi:hypothetical protein
MTTTTQLSQARCYVPPYFRLSDPSHSRLRQRDCPALREA